MGKVVRNSVIATLCVILTYYVHESWVKYQSMQTALNIKEENVEVFDFPGVTVCAYDIDWFSKTPSPQSFQGLLEDNSTRGPRITGFLIAGNKKFV